MVDKPKCSQCNERAVFSKGLCSRCYGIQWRAQKKAERDSQQSAQSTALATVAPVTIEGEIIKDEESQPVSETNAPTSEVHLIARNPAEMQAAQADLTAWLKHKLTIVEAEVRDMNAAINEARNNNWKTDALTRARNRAVSLETYYFKMLMAVEAGYTMIPEFPIDIFAIRVTRANVRAANGEATGSWSWPRINNERPDRAPAGAGEYKNPSQMVRHYEWKTKDSEGKEVVHRTTSAAAWQDEVVFPMIAARPAVMSATAEAMALKVFDQVGVCLPVQQTRDGRALATWGKGDPLILGQILHERASGLKVVSFIIAWHLNLNDL